MLTPEDVLAARLLFAKMPHARELLIERVDALQAQPDAPGLLQRLVDVGILTRPQASYIHAGVERYKQARGMRLYAKQLVAHGVPAERLQAVARRLHGGGSMAVLGASLIEAELVTLEQEQELRGAAQASFEQHLARLCEGFEASAAAASEDAPLRRRDTTRRFLARAVGLGAAIDATAAPVPPELASAAPASPPEAVTRKLDPLQSAREEAGSESVELDLPSATSLLLKTPLTGLDGSGEPFEVPEWIDRSDPRRGDRIQDYELLGRVGAGAMGVVYLARDPGQPSLPIAIKVLPADADAEAKGRFKREILANSFFSHPGALEIYDAGEVATGEHFLAMEFFDGRDLERVLEGEERLEPAVVLELAAQTLAPLRAAHDAALVHRDVKPGNILVSHDRRVARLMDFGLARIGDLGDFRSKVFQTRNFGITGTPFYLSPEQAAEDEIGPPSDLYSLGVVIYRMLAGRLPFKAKSAKGFVMAHMTKTPLPLREAHPPLAALPAALHELVAGLLEKEPEDRPTGADVAATLRALLAELG